MEDEIAVRRRGPVGRIVDALSFRMWHATVSLYVAAAGLVGFELIVAMFGYLTLWPFAIPATVAAIGVVAIIRSRVLHRRRED